MLTCTRCQACIFVNDITFDVFGGTRTTFTVFTAHVDWHAGLQQDLGGRNPGRHLQQPIRPHEPDFERF